MIKVNLVKSIPVGSSPSAASLVEGGDGPIEIGSQEIQKQGAIRLLIILLFPLGLYFYESQNVPDLRRQVQKRNSEIQVLQTKNNNAKGAVEEILKFNEDKEKLQRQVDTLESLQKDRDLEVKILDNIQKDIPEKVWLEKIEFKDADLKIWGMAVTDSDVSAFIDSLSKIYTIQSVIPVRSADKVTDRGVYKAFELNSKVDRQSYQRAGR